MVGKYRTDEAGRRITHFVLLTDDDVKRWYDNLRAKSNLTAGVYLRGLGFYCDRMETTPKKVLEDAREIKPLQDQFMDFVRGMEKEGKKGSYIARYKKVLHSWTRHNGIEFKSIANIKNENVNERTQNESVPSQDDLGKILRHAGLRAKVEIALIAFSGLRPRSISNDDGSDCLRMKDIPELKIQDGKIMVEKMPAQIKVKATMNKGEKHAYSTFLGPEGMTYLLEYLEYRLSEGEAIDMESPLIQYDRDVKRQHKFVPTFYIEREIREALIDAGFYEIRKNKQGKDIKSPTKRPYVLRAYFATAMDISEQKGYLSHSWRQLWMGHVGDMESRYSTNKKLSEDDIDEMRGAYEKCLQFLETTRKGLTEEEISKTIDEKMNEKLTELTAEFLKKIGYSETEAQEMKNLPDDELANRVGKNLRNNGRKQKAINVPELDRYLEEGWEYTGNLPDGRVMIKIPDF